VVITGNCGPNAVRTLSAGGIEVVVGQTGSVRQAVEDYVAGKLKATKEPNVSDHYGMGASGRESGGFSQASLGKAGVVRGKGCGRGMGRGGGMGRWSDAAGGQSQVQAGPQTLSREEELKSLKIQASEMREQMEKIESRIRNLEK
jgi:hypothetical protein